MYPINIESHYQLKQEVSMGRLSRGNDYMFVILRKMVVTEGNANQVINKLGTEGIIEKQEGFVDLTVMQQKTRKDEGEIMIRWESEAYLAGHKANHGKPKPDYLIHQKQVDMR